MCPEETSGFLYRFPARLGRHYQGFVNATSNLTEMTSVFVDFPNGPTPSHAFPIFHSMEFHLTGNTAKEGRYILGLGCHARKFEYDEGTGLASFEVEHVLKNDEEPVKTGALTCSWWGHVASEWSVLRVKGDPTFQAHDYLEIDDILAGEGTRYRGGIVTGIEDGGSLAVYDLLFD